MRVQNTKFVCTLGPASESTKILEEMMRAGMDVARLNFSHGDYSHHAELIKNIRKIAKKLNIPLAIMQDLQGPKIRIGTISDNGIEVKKNEEIVLTCDKQSGKKIPVQYKDLYRDVKRNSVLLIDDGLIELKVKKITNKDIVCICQNDGVIKKNKGINVPNGNITTAAITAKDKKDLIFGLKHGIDYVALSFIKEAKDVLDVKKLIGEKNVKVIAKIERAQAVKNLDEIIAVADALMVARGDLAMEIGPEKVPIVQKEMIRKCNLAGKPVITATQMLQSMIDSPQPTRAEVSDTANAIFDHTDAIMLSNESAVGKYPVKAVKVFAKVAQTVEKELKKHNQLLPVRSINDKVDYYDALGFETCQLAEATNAKNIIVVTLSGKSAQYISKHRSYIPTIVITPSEKTKNQLSLLWGLNEIVIGKVGRKKYLEDIKQILEKNNSVKKGQKVVILYTHTKEKRIVSTTI
ncbi:pyruvate kinase [bacterium]|nr:pyruvate kinase [bacterium]